MNLKLDISSQTEDFFDDARILGIIAPLKNYKFCWHLNNRLGYNFVLDPTKEITLAKKGRNYFFPVYTHQETSSLAEHFLYYNHYEGEFLLPEFKHIDFLWLIKGGGLENEQIQGILSAVKQLEHVQLITELTNEQIKNKSHLIL